MLSKNLAIVVVPRDRLSTFPGCLQALYMNTDRPFRVIVIAGGADGATKEYLRGLQVEKGNLNVIFTERVLMQAEARQIALSQVHERFCVVLENDTIVHTNWLAPLWHCMQEERAAVVMPLVLWYRGIHAAGCTFENRIENGKVVFRHKILYKEIHRKRIDYPECHCILIDREAFPRGIEIFDEVEPFDVDLGLTLRKHGLSVFLEPSSVATYSPSPPLELRDIPVFRLRWDPETWECRNKQFMQKWNVTYEPSAKLASYRRQMLKLGLARWFPGQLAVAVSNFTFGWANRLQSLAQSKVA